MNEQHAVARAMTAGTSVRGRLDLLLPAGLLAVALVFVRALVYTPPDLAQGPVQRILYVHASAAWTGFMAFGLVAVAGALYLWLRDERLDRFAASSAEVGLVFTSVVLITGPLWAKPIWGIYWSWDDARLTSTLFLWFIYLGYLVLRGAIEDRLLRARYSAILGVLGALLIPFIHVSVLLFDTLHPEPIAAAPSVFTEKRQMPGVMLTTLLLATAACTLLYIGFVRYRYRLELERETLARTREQHHA